MICHDMLEVVRKDTLSAGGGLRFGVGLVDLVSSTT